MNVIRFFKRLWAKRSMNTYLQWLRSEGCRIGEGTKVFSRPESIFIDTTRPWLIEIGKNVQITGGVKILTHGYDWAVLKGIYGEVYGSAGKVTIGDNCFIGMNAIILKGVKIGNNCVIGSGSVVTRDIPDNSVAVGSPARVICTIEELRRKRATAQKEEARQLVLEYYKVYGKKPSEDILAEFFWLFTPRNELKRASFIKKMNCVNNYEESMRRFLNSRPEFESFEQFLDYCFNK